MKNLEGGYGAPKERAEAISTYLQDKHWTNDNKNSIENLASINYVQHFFNIGSFAINEFDAALSALTSTKSNKQPDFGSYN